MKKIPLALLLSSLANAPLPAQLPQSSMAQAAAPLTSPGSAGPRYDVTSPAFGAVGDGKKDDTAAIQAAFSACGNTFKDAPANQRQNSGIVEFPGGRSYLVSQTIHTYSCQIEGATGNIQGPYSPPRLLWNGPAAGAVAHISAFSISSNTVTFSADNSLSAGEFVEISGLSAGFFLNRAIVQVSSSGLSAHQFEAVLSFAWPNVSSTADSGSATTVNVFLDLPSNARYQQSIHNMMLVNKAPHQANSFDVGIYFGSRVDTGTRLTNTWIHGARKYGYYFSAGGINVNFDQGWRADGAKVAGIYWRIGGGDIFGVANGTIDNSRLAFDSSSGGAAIILDNSACVPNSHVHFTARNFKIEVNTSIQNGLGVFTLYDCPSNPIAEQFFLDFENTWVSPGSQVRTAHFPSFVMSPPNDKALLLSVLNSQFPNGAQTNTTTRWVGLPALARHDILGADGMIPMLAYAPSISSGAEGPAHASSPIQLLGDVNIEQLWQYGIHASDLLYADRDFNQLANGTTVFAGQFLAPPVDWNREASPRIALDIVSQTGTTGAPNGGQTTCSAAIHTHLLICSSAADLSAGQHISIGAEVDKTIQSIDATDENAVRVQLDGNLADSHLRQTLTFSPPRLAPEIQLPAKSPAAPSALSWARGDTQQNSNAAAQGVAAWVNVADGAPGSWAGIPLGDRNGKIQASQLSASTTVGSGDVVLANHPTVNALTGTGLTTLNDLAVKGRCLGCAPSSSRAAQAFCVGTASSSSTLLLFGAGGSQTSCTQSPGPRALQQIVTATDGTLSNLAVRCGHQGAQPSSGTFSLWTLPSGIAMQNASSGINTGLTVTVGNSASNANRTLIDKVHTFQYQAGDMIRIQFTTEARETLTDCTASFSY